MALMRRLLAARRERESREWQGEKVAVGERERARKREKERGTERGTGGHQKLEEEAESEEERSESERGRYGEEEVVALTRGGGKWMTAAGVSGRKTTGGKGT